MVLLHKEISKQKHDAKQAQPTNFIDFTEINK